MTIDSQLVSNLLLGIVALITLAGLVGVVLSFWSLGRSAYRKE